MIIMDDKTSIETRIAVLETKNEAENEDIKEIKKEVHDINVYLRNELTNKITDIRENERSKRQQRDAKWQIWGAIGVASISLVITLIHIFI